MKEVFAEAARRDEVLQILVGCGNDPDVDLDRGMAADTVELSVCEDPQQARLRSGRHVADLVEEKRAAVGLLEAALTLGRGPGKGTLLVSEKFGFDQLVRNGRHVECDEGHARSRRMPMQRLGDKFLAGA